MNILIENSDFFNNMKEKESFEFMLTYRFMKQFSESSHICALL